MVSFWWDSVSQTTELSLLGVVILYWVVVVVSRRGNSDKEMLGEILLVGYVSVRIILGAMEVSR